VPGPGDGRGAGGSLAATFRQALAWPPILGLLPRSLIRISHWEPAWEHLGNFPQAFTRLALIEAVSMPIDREPVDREPAERSASTAS
jgi:hypothetical protein